MLSNIEKILEKHMYKRLYTFLDNKNIVHGIQTTILYISCFNITENIRKALDDRNIGCTVFADLHEAFRCCRPSDTVNKIESLWDS